MAQGSRSLASQVDHDLRRADGHGQRLDVGVRRVQGRYGQPRSGSSGTDDQHQVSTGASARIDADLDMVARQRFEP